MGLPVWRVPSPIDTKKAAKADLTSSARSPIRRRRTPTSANHHHRRWADLDSLANEASRRSLLSPNEPTFANTAFTHSPSPYNSWRDPEAPLPPPVPESRHYTRGSDEDVETILENAFSRYTGAYDEVLGRVSLTRPERGDLRDELSRHYQPASREARSSRARQPELTWDFAPARHARQADASREDESLPDGVQSNHASGRDLDSHVPFPPLRRVSRRETSQTVGLLSAQLGRHPRAVDGLGDRDRSFSPDHETSAWDTMLSTIAPDVHQPSADSSFTSAAASASFSASNRGSRSGRSSNSNSAASSRTNLTVPSLHERDPALACDTTDDESSLGSDDEALYGPTAVRRSRAAETAQPEAAADSHDSALDRDFRNLRDSFFQSSDSFDRRLRSLHHHLEYHHPDGSSDTTHALSHLRPQTSRHHVPAAYGPLSRGTWAMASPRRQNMPHFRPTSSYTFAPVPSTNDPNSARLTSSFPPVASPPGRPRDQASSVSPPPPAQASRTGASDPSSQSASFTVDPELDQMRGILERLTRRDDIPESFWISAGLAPPLARNVDRVVRSSSSSSSFPSGFIGMPPPRLHFGEYTTAQLADAANSEIDSLRDRITRQRRHLAHQERLMRATAGDDGPPRRPLEHYQQRQRRREHGHRLAHSASPRAAGTEEAPLPPPAVTERSPTQGPVRSPLAQRRSRSRSPASAAAVAASVLRPERRLHRRRA